MRLNLTQILHLKLMWTLISLFLAIAFILLTYLPLILHGGIIVDDWGDIAHNLTCANFSDCYLSWFPLFSNRPLAPLPITTLTFLFETNFSAYLICNTAIYLAAIYLFASVIKKIVTYEAALIFFLLASIPMIAMPLVSSPINNLLQQYRFFIGQSHYGFYINKPIKNYGYSFTLRTFFYYLVF